MNALPRLRRCGALLLLLTTGALAAPAPATPAAAPNDLAEARRLAEQRDMTRARPLFERYIAAHPGDSEARFLFGLALAVESHNQPGEAAVALRLEARGQLLEAQRLGSTEPLVAQMLGTLKPDGSPPPPDQFSTDRQVNALMTDAEAAFNRGDFARAAELHEQALTLEPKNYYAALYCGDAWFSLKDYDRAGTWFARAIAINPDIETAHRYWADALMHQRKLDAATDQYIEAVVAEPYNRLTRERFRQYAGNFELPYHPGAPALPKAAVAMQDGKPEIQLGRDQDEYAGALALAYAAACAKVRTEDFARLHPTEKTPRRSLAEEVEGLRTMLQVARELAAAPTPPKPDLVARWRPSFDRLERIERDGLLEAFALLERADQDLARDYPAYRAAHREQVKRYLQRYWCEQD